MFDTSRLVGCNDRWNVPSAGFGGKPWHRGVRSVLLAAARECNVHERSGRLFWRGAAVGGC